MSKAHPHHHHHQRHQVSAVAFHNMTVVSDPQGQGHQYSKGQQQRSRPHPQQRRANPLTSCFCCSKRSGDKAVTVNGGQTSAAIDKLTPKEDDSTPTNHKFFPRSIVDGEVIRSGERPHQSVAENSNGDSDVHSEHGLIGSAKEIQPHRRAPDPPNPILRKSKPRLSSDHGNNVIEFPDNSIENIDAEDDSQWRQPASRDFRQTQSVREPRNNPKPAIVHRHESERKPETPHPKDGEMPCWCDTTMEFAKALAGQGPVRTPWYETPEVVKRGLAKTMDGHTKKQQEALFEILTTEASYYLSLATLFEVFYNHPDLNPAKNSKIITRSEKHHLFSSIGAVQETCANFLSDMRELFTKDPMMVKLMDLVYRTSEEKFIAYVNYVKNQPYQTLALSKLMKRPDFANLINKLQSDPRCAFLDLGSFLTMPFQRVTRLRLLIATVLKYAPRNSTVYQDGLVALASLEHVLTQCESQRSIMEQKQRILELSMRLTYKANRKAITTQHQRLIKEGELRSINPLSRAGETGGTFSRMASLSRNRSGTLSLFLFTDFLVIAKKKGPEELSVKAVIFLNQLHVKPCPLPEPAAISKFNLSEASETPAPSSQPTSPTTAPSTPNETSIISPSFGSQTLAYGFIISSTDVASNVDSSAEHLITYHLQTPTLSERERWIDALDPKYYNVPEHMRQAVCEGPQMRIIHPYSPKQDDELALKEGDQVSILVSLEDGWRKGMLADGRAGWFPEKIGVEIQDVSLKMEYTKEFMQREEAQRVYQRRKELETQPRNKFGDIAQH